MMTFPTEWNVIKAMFQTTNQMYTYIYIYIHGSMMFNDDLTCFTFIWSNSNLENSVSDIPSEKITMFVGEINKSSSISPAALTQARSVSFSVHLWAFFIPSHLYPFLLVSKLNLSALESGIKQELTAPLLLNFWAKSHLVFEEIVKDPVAANDNQIALTRQFLGLE